MDALVGVDRWMHWQMHEWIGGWWMDGGRMVDKWRMVDGGICNGCMDV